MRQLRPLDQDVRFQAIEVHDLVLPLRPEVSCEYRRLFQIFAGRRADRYFECVVSLIQSVERVPIAFQGLQPLSALLSLVFDPVIVATQNGHILGHV